MNIHAIVDYSYLYYKYKFQLEDPDDPVNNIKYKKLKRLTAPYDNGSVVIEKDISLIYYTIREIEGFRKELEKYGHNVILSICFDMPSKRKETTGVATEGEADAASNYKAKRVKVLNDDDFKDIRIVQKMLSDAGHNTYRIEGYEADDLVAHLVAKYQESFDYTIIYTPDKDLLVNINNKVGAKRYKATKGYSLVDKNNFSEYLSVEFKCGVPYNSIMLLLSTVGDSSDNIAGIKGFGPKAFDKLIAYLNKKGVNWEECGTYEKTLELIEMCRGKFSNDFIDGSISGIRKLGTAVFDKIVQYLENEGIDCSECDSSDKLIKFLEDGRGYLPDESVKQAIESLSMVRPMIVEEGLIEPPTKVSSVELRSASYLTAGMQTLVV